MRISDITLDDFATKLPTLKDCRTYDGNGTTIFSGNDGGSTVILFQNGCADSAVMIEVDGIYA